MDVLGIFSKGVGFHWNKCTQQFEVTEFENINSIQVARIEKFEDFQYEPRE